MNSNETQTLKYFETTPLKFFLMSTCTFGLYELYWSYKNWKYIKQRDDSKILPVVRAIFYTLMFYTILTDISDKHGTKYLKNSFIKGSLAISLLILGALWKLPDPYWFLTYLTFLPMLPAVYAITEINSDVTAQHPAKKHSIWNFVAYIAGGPIVLLMALSAIGFFPSTSVIDGQSMWNRDIEFLRNENLLVKDEKILYFYSGGLFSIKDDGQFISDRYIVTYWRDPDTNELYYADAAYSEVKDVKVEWSRSFLEDTIVTIDKGNEEKFEMWLSNENKGDKKFVDELKYKWEYYKKNMLKSPNSYIEPVS